MGVEHLWELISPAGRKVPLDSLNDKRIAVDTSIWLTSFLQAMRDGDGNIVRNAHLLGMFNRICKLLFWHIKPVFIFDGGAPALKHRTIQKRRKRRDALT